MRKKFNDDNSKYLNKKESLYKIKNFLLIICNTTVNNLHGILKKIKSNQRLTGNYKKEFKRQKMQADTVKSRVLDTEFYS